ncbi:MAG: hypothetical protein R3D05_01460 [Dongiaceae bacterium]
MDSSLALIADKEDNDRKLAQPAKGSKVRAVTRHRGVVSKQADPREIIKSYHSWKSY